MSGLADTVILKSGEKLEGRILSETDTDVTIEVNVTASIKDQREIKKADVDKIEKVQPDEETWTSLKNLTLGDESLEVTDYQRAISALNGFVAQFPQSSHAAEAKQRLAAFQEEAKRVEAGEMKLDGKWMTADQVKEERVQVNGRVLFGRMKRYAATNQLIEALNTFEAIERTASGSSSYPDAVALARQVAPLVKAAAEQRRQQLKAQAEERKRRLDNVQGDEKLRLESLQRQQIQQTEAAVLRMEQSGAKWLPLTPATERSLSATSTKAGGMATRLNNHNVPRMKESLGAAERARQAIEDNELDVAEKALSEARLAWPKNELVERLQPKLAAAKTKATEAAAEKSRADKAAAAANATSTDAETKAKAKAAANLAPSSAPAPIAVEEPKPEGSVLGKPAFWIILLVVLGLATLGFKALGKFRNAEKNDLDQ
jgi:hypothetical protein